MVRDQKEITINGLRHIEKDVYSQKKVTKEDRRLIEELKFLKEDLLKKQQNIEETSRKHQDLLSVLDKNLGVKDKKSASMLQETELLE